jgi:uncharacterized protein (DUF1499 family)
MYPTIAIVAAVALSPVIILAILSMTARRPTNLGVKDGRLAECPRSDNCVSTQASDEKHRMEPIPFAGSREEAIARLKGVLAGLPRMKIITEQTDYLHVEATTRIFRFVDDVEFYVDERAKVIHFRSASRSGSKDFGVNRARMEKVWEALGRTGSQ